MRKRIQASIRQFVSELRRRRVVRVAVAYLAVAFVVVQGAEAVLPPLGWDGLHTAIVVVSIAGLPVALVLSWVFDISPEGLVVTGPLEDAPARSGVVVPAETPEYPSTSVAVLPFRNVGDDPENVYFSEGMHDDLLTSLGHLQELKVVSAASVTGRGMVELGSREIAHRLRVGSVVEGSVRRAGKRIRIVARLVDTASDRQVWAETYDRALEDIFEIQSDVATQITQSLSIRLSEEESRRLSLAPTKDLAAYDLYLRARFQWNRRTESGISSSIDLLKRAVDRDPDFALAHAGLADAYATLGIYSAEPPGSVMPAAEAAASKALELDPDLAEALTARACVRSLYRWEWEGAEEDFRKACALAPGYATARHWYATNHLALRRRFEEAHEALSTAAELDPEAPAIDASIGLLLLLEHRYEEAGERLAGLTEVRPDFAMGHFFLGAVRERQGRFDEAVEALERAAVLRRRPPEVLAALAQTLTFAGRSEEAEEQLNALRFLAQTRWVSPTRFAQIAFAKGDLDAGFAHLDAAIEARALDLPWFAVNPAFTEAHADPRFDQVRARLQLD